MTPKTQPARFAAFEKYFFRFALALFVLSGLLFGIAVLFANYVVAVPAAITAFTGMLIYVHGGQFVFGLLRIFKLLFVIRPKFHSGSAWRSLFAMVLAPVAAYGTYITFFLMALTGCAA
jgi:CDP-diglyceride synthetase